MSVMVASKAVQVKHQFELFEAGGSGEWKFPSRPVRT
jgi:hypothetical protein